MKFAPTYHAHSQSCERTRSTSYGGATASSFLWFSIDCG
jgi:hypothetical protein